MPKPPPRAQRRSSKPAAKTPDAPLLDQRQLDLIGLALIAFGVLVAIPLYRAGTGGFVGDAVADGARMLLGAAAYGAPLLLIAGGLVAVSPLELKACMRIAAGGLCAFSAVTLIARASAGPDNAASWTGTHLRDAGGLLGESLWSLCHSAFGSFGPYVIAIVLLMGAALLLTGAELASVLRGAGRGLSRAAAVPGRIRAERRADRAMELADTSSPVMRAVQEQEWERSLDAREAALASGVSMGPITASATREVTATGAGTATGTRRRRKAAPDMAPDPTATGVLPADAPRTWTSRDEDPRTWSSTADATGSGTIAPPEVPGIAPTVSRGPRRAQLIDGAERFPDFYGGDGPVWIGPDDAREEAAPAPKARKPKKPAKYPDPLEDFEAELSAAREEDGADLPAERNGQFSEAAELVEEHGAVLDDPMSDDVPDVFDPLGDPVAEAEAAERAAAHEAVVDAEVPHASDERAPVGPEALTPMGRYRAEVTGSPEFPWKIPPRRVLTRSAKVAPGADRIDQEQTSALLLEALGHFGVSAELVGCVSGPHITRYELRLAPGVKMNKVANLKDDLAYALAATDIRILAPIPGKTAVGVEVPNRNRAIVRLGDVFADAPPKSSPLTVWLGKDVEGQSVFADLAKMPHLLVAGTTGAGKSACINGMLSSILLAATPTDVRMVLVDPKQVELTPYASLPHLLTPVITSPKQAATALQNLVREMEARYSTMALSKTRNLIEMNRVRRERGEAEFPYILCVIDELADLMMVAPGEVEDSIIRIAQKARAVGIHLVLATQSPRVDVITGMIKANVPSRIAFAVSSQTDSRVILDQNGAESLLGQGDMLFSPVGTAKLQRIQGAYIDDEQIEQITQYWRKQGEPDFNDELLEEIVDEAAADEAKGDGLDPDEDPMLEEAIRLVVEMGTASTSMIQRRLRVGYTRAGRLIDMLERRNVISGYEGSKARNVLIGPGEVERVVAQVRARGEASKPSLFPGGESAPAPAQTIEDVLAQDEAGPAAGRLTPGDGVDGGVPSTDDTSSGSAVAPVGDR